MGYFLSGNIDQTNPLIADSQREYLNALQLDSYALFIFDRAVLGLCECVGQRHIFQLQMFQNTNLSHLSSLGERGKKNGEKCHVDSCQSNVKP